MKVISDQMTHTNMAIQPNNCTATAGISRDRTVTFPIADRSTVGAVASACDSSTLGGIGVAVASSTGSTCSRNALLPAVNSVDATGSTTADVTSGADSETVGTAMTIGGAASRYAQLLGNATDQPETPACKSIQPTIGQRSTAAMVVR